MSKYLVTGGAGFIGSAVVQMLINSGHDVVTIDNLSTGRLKNIPKECEFIKGSVYDKSIIKKLDEKSFDAILHIAGQSSGEISFEDPVYDLQTNTQSTIMLLDYAKRNNCRNFIYASTMSVYGDQENPHASENSSLNPKSFYAVGKLASEKYMEIYSTYGIKCTALRLFNVYGVGQNMTNMKQGMVSIFLTMAINDGCISVKGSKNRFRDFVYIDDVVDAFAKSIFRSKGEMFEVYNVSSGEKRTVAELIDRITYFTPHDVTVEYLAGTPGDQFGIYGNNDKVQRDLNWETTVSFEEGTERMLEWALKKDAICKETV